MTGNLQEAFQACGEDLRREESFRNHYIAREDGASLELAQRMAMEKRPVKILFAGQRGAGKTTELLRVLHDTGETLYTVYINLDNIHEKSGAAEIMVAAGAGLFRKLIDDRMAISENAVKSFSAWLREAVKAPAEEKAGGLSGVLELFTKIADRQRKKESRAEISAVFESRHEELAQKLTEIAGEIHTKSGHDLLLIIDGLEKLGKTQAVSFLMESGLLDFGFKVICTVPFQLLHSAEFRELRPSFDLVCVQPLVDVGPVAKARGGMGDLRDIVDKRVGKELIDNMALDTLIQNSGGNPGELLRFTGNCCIKAAMQGRSKIEMATVEQVLEDFRLEMKRFLSPEEWLKLAQVQKDKVAPVDELLSYLLETGTVLEYPGRREMYQVHPALLPVLRERTGP